MNPETIPTEEEIGAVRLDEVSPAVIARVIQEALGCPIIEVSCKECHERRICRDYDGPRWTCEDCGTEQSLMDGLGAVDDEVNAYLGTK